MSSNTLIVLLLMATYALWISLPLLPAVLIYRLFPDTPVTLSGPFQKLTISAGGAFAAYFLTLLASLYLVRPISSAVRNPPNSQWTLTGTLRVEDENGKEQPVPQTGVAAFVDPPPATVVGDRFTADIALTKAQLWPTVRVEVPGIGAHTLNLDPSKVDFDVDEDKYVIQLNEPLIVRKVGTLQAGDPEALKKINEVTR